ncbi:nitroreductase family protein [Chondromyces crocatus]|uniref:NADH dehydrogenase n=1 Tax=Chondromyces crocatus TaxID=52 RepID=A0A0K1EFW0_CHOCO|nr:nitroreductase family protein [Chondromyces crocatus]AKT39473.1 NADH dehydrogenase [Chondromyces crocatus]
MSTEHDTQTLSRSHDLAPLTVPEAIEARRSIRKYKPVPVSDADLTRIFELTSRAPSSINIQPWRFAFVRDTQLKTQLRAAAFDQAQVEAAPVVIVAYSDMTDALAHLDDVIHPGVQGEARQATFQRASGYFGSLDETKRKAFGDGQTFIAVGYLSLAAQSLGYATSIMGGFDPEKVKTLLGLPEPSTVVAVIALGVADETGYAPHRHALSRIVHEAGAAAAHEESPSVPAAPASALHASTVAQL